MCRLVILRQTSTDGADQEVYLTAAPGAFGQDFGTTGRWIPLAVITEKDLLQKTARSGTEHGHAVIRQAGGHHLEFLLEGRCGRTDWFT